MPNLIRYSLRNQMPILMQNMKATCVNKMNAWNYKRRHPENGLGYDMQENYANLWNACADYDNNHHGSYLTDKITDYDFVDDEILEYIVIKESKGGVDWLRFFIEDTYLYDMSDTNLELLRMCRLFSYYLLF